MRFTEIEPGDSIDSMSKIFLKVTKCTVTSAIPFFNSSYLGQRYRNPRLWSNPKQIYQG